MTDFEMKEYIVEIDASEINEDELFIGHIRHNSKELIRCKDCKHRFIAHPRYAPIAAMCDLDTGDPFELGRKAYDDNWFCADGERKDNE